MLLIADSKILNEKHRTNFPNLDLTKKDIYLSFKFLGLIIFTFYIKKIGRLFS